MGYVENIGHAAMLAGKRERILAQPGLSDATKRRLKGLRPVYDAPIVHQHREMVAADLGRYEPPAPKLICNPVPPNPGFWWRKPRTGLRGSRSLPDVPRATVKQIMEAVAKAATAHRGDGAEPFDVHEMTSPRRSRLISWPRQIAMTLCIELRPDMSLPEIGKAFKKDHTTAMHARNMVPARLAAGEPMTTAIYNAARDSLKPITVAESPAAISIGGAQRSEHP